MTQEITGPFSTKEGSEVEKTIKQSKKTHKIILTMML